MMDWLKKWYPSILYNAGEMAIVFLAGLWLRIEPNYVCIIILAFVLPRLAIGKPKHYKSWQLCLVWTTAAFMSMFIVAKAGMIVSVFMAIMFALTTSGRTDCKELFMWKPKGESKYQREIDHVKYNPIDPNLVAFEEMLQRENDNFSFMCYKCIFKEGKTWNETARHLDTETYKLTPVVDKIAFAIRVSCKI